MTNSITSAKCPSLLSSGNYGMSQNRCTDDSKEYIFVKLTDSAYRAVEEYQRNEHAKRFANGQRARIQFIGNSGVIHFPTPSDSGNNGGGSGEGRGREFGFSIDDVEGSLECIQQTQHDLDVLGSLSYRMRIHANDDIYDTTRTKMAIAEETEKSKCIREIKPNQTDIGRKVKKFSTLSSASASNSNNSASPSSFHNSNNINHHTSHPHVGHSNGNNSTNNSNNNINSSSSSYLLSHSNRNKLTATLSSNSPPMNGLGGGSSKLGASNATSSSRSPNPTMLGGSGTIANSRYGSHTTSAVASSSSSAATTTNLYSQNNASLPSLSASSLSSTLASGIANGYASAANNSPPDSTAGVVGKVHKASASSGGGNMNFTAGASANMRGNGNSNGGAKALIIGGGSTGGGNKQSSTSSGSSGSKLPDISRRKIRERLIHLLALKPFKKPELYSRLQNEGLRDRERSLISNLLRDISSLSRDNTYNLKRLIWNDVNENWPYYTEQELQQLKRRKPQNLTPPNCSDAGSSTSGQSPTSTHTGSPPPMVGSGVGGSGSLKRTSLESDRYDDTMLGVQAKKQRISHFKKEANPTNVGGPNRIGGGAGFGSSGSSNYTQQNNRLTSYSPHGGNGSSHNSQTAPDENSVNNDLSYNVLDNDVMPHIERSSGSNYYSAGNISRKTNGNNTNNVNSKNAGLAGNSKEKRNSAGSNSSNSSAASGTYVASQERSSKELMRKSVTSSVSPTPYGANFVPESKTGGSSSSNNVNSNNRSGGTSSSKNINSSYQRHSPSFAQQQQLQHKSTSSNSAINSPKAHVVQMSPKEELNSDNNSNSGSSSAHRNNANSSSSSRYQQNTARSASKAARSPSSPQQQQQQQRHHQQQQSSHYYKQPSPTNSQYQHPQQQPQPQAQMQSQQPQSLQQQQPSPTQQMAAAASSYALITNPLNKPRYDFTKYTPITTIEERRKYKTEFENDYGEYLRLLNQIEGVGNRFRNLAARLENVPPGGTEHYNIKQQIFNEYERIRNEEALKRKQRFDYLHEKLAYIKQLVSDYDKTLTDGNAAAAMSAAQPQQQQQQQQPQLQHQEQHQSMAQNHQAQQYTACIQQSPAPETANSSVTAAAGGIVGDGDAAANMLSATTHNSRLSPMVASGDSNSPPTAQRNYHSRQQQQHQRQNYQQHHDAETIQRLPNHSPTAQSDTNNAATTQHHLQQQQQQQLHYNGHHVPHDNNNNNGHNNDTDSDDSSDSNDDDDDDDDDSNSNSNDDDDDDNDRY